MEILNSVVNHSPVYLLLVARVSGLFLLAPVLGNAMIPMLIRVALVLLVAWVLYPIYGMGVLDPPIDVPSLVTALGGELAIGLIVGLVASLIFTAFLMAGNVVGTQIGFGMAAEFNPAFPAVRSTVIDEFYSIVGTLVFLVINGHLLLVQAFDRTFRAVPLGGAIHPEAVAMPIGQLLSEVFAAAFQLALPILAAILLTDVAFGLVARAVPQINVFFLGLPLKVLLGLVALSLAMPGIIAAMESQIEAGVRNVVNIAAAL